MGPIRLGNGYRRSGRGFRCPIGKALRLARKARIPTRKARKAIDRALALHLSHIEPRRWLSERHRWDPESHPLAFGGPSPRRGASCARRGKRSMAFGAPSMASGVPGYGSRSSIDGIRSLAYKVRRVVDESFTVSRRDGRQESALAGAGTQCGPCGALVGHRDLPGISRLLFVGTGRQIDPVRPYVKRGI